MISRLIDELVVFTEKVGTLSRSSNGFLYSTDYYKTSDGRIVFLTFRTDQITSLWLIDEDGFMSEEDLVKILVDPDFEPKWQKPLLKQYAIRKRQ